MIKKSYKGIKFFGLSLFILSFLITGVNQISSAPIGSGIGLNDINITKDPRPSPPPEIAVWMCDNRALVKPYKKG